MASELASADAGAAGAADSRASDCACSTFSGRGNDVGVGLSGAEAVSALRDKRSSVLDFTGDDFTDGLDSSEAEATDGLSDFSARREMVLLLAEEVFSIFSALAVRDGFELSRLYILPGAGDEFVSASERFSFCADGPAEGGNVRKGSDGGIAIDGGGSLKEDPGADSNGPEEGGGGGTVRLAALPGLPDTPARFCQLAQPARPRQQPVITSRPKRDFINNLLSLS